MHAAPLTDDLRVQDGNSVAEPGDERALIEGCRRGVRAAQARVLREHAPRLEGFFARLSVPGSDVAALIQETFTRAILRFPRLRGRTKIWPWLFAIAIDVLSSHPHNQDGTRRFALELTGDEPLAPSGRTLDRADEAERLLARIHRHLVDVGARARLAYLLHVIEGLSVRDASALMHAPRFLTSLRIVWARRALLASCATDPLLGPLLGREVSS